MQSVFSNFDDHILYISQNVEVDWYHLPQQSGLIPVFLGIDIGSTSTKAIVMKAQQEDQNILLGLYTRTMGQPIKATQSLLRVLREIEERNNIQLEFWGVGTTGSGRKFIHKVLNADLVIDEITAHARAAYALNPQVDTIIEIGGQDSKFTVMKNGQVTFSVMNYVCAAGTGSFIEVQAAVKRAIVRVFCAGGWYTIAAVQRSLHRVHGAGFELFNEPGLFKTGVAGGGVAFGEG